MPKLSCRSCGREIYTVSPLEALVGEERRCPRCGAFLFDERREAERRVTHRRVNPPQDPGPPQPKGKAKAKNGGTKAAGGGAEAAGGGERRVAVRRTARRRGGGTPPPAQKKPGG